MDNRRVRKLTLSHETLRVLTGEEMKAVVGGSTNPTYFASACEGCNLGWPSDGCFTGATEGDCPSRANPDTCHDHERSAHCSAIETRCC
jgi:hypothetical protein